MTRADLDEFVACYQPGENLPDPHILAQEIADDLRSALTQIEDILGDLERRVPANDNP